VYPSIYTGDTQPPESLNI